MAYFKFENGKTALNDTNLNAMQKGLLELVFPVGSTYITQTNTNPSTILEFGTWERFKGVLAVGLDENDTDKYFNEIGKKGGEKKHTLTTNEIPEHKHSVPYDVRDNATNFGTSYSIALCNGGTVRETLETNNTGGGEAHNNVQPYEVVGYMWIRRS